VASLSRKRHKSDNTKKQRPLQMTPILQNTWLNSSNKREGYPQRLSKEHAMGFLSWIILGLIAGALAKWLMPGENGGGWFLTMLLGIAGAFVGGYVGSLAGFGGADGLNIGSIVTATLGAFILLFVYTRFIKD
jgi:uncharacterized membrane protein YeaQ/YmgE (transglycosylase-associated protein family)